MRIPFAGCAVALLMLAGCQSAPQHTLGKPDADAKAASVGSLMTASVPSSPVLVRGTLVEKCPVTGCWFKLRDKSGTIKIDLRASGATAAEIGLGAEVTVTGKPTRAADEAVVEASGVTY